MIIQRFSYSDDNNNIFTIKRKVSKGQATNNSSTLLSVAQIGQERILKTIKPRRAFATLASDPNIKCTFTVGSAAQLAALRTTPVIQEVDEFGNQLQWNVTSVKGERERVPVVGDTGQVDGDIP